VVHGVGMIGSGFMGRTWSEVTRRLPGCELRGVAVGRRAAALAADFGVPEFDSIDALLASDDIDVVVISTPPSLHAEHVVAALAAGKHVLVEKPMAWTAAESLALDNAARHAQLQLAVVSHHRFRNSPRTAKRLLDEGAIGDVRMVTVTGVSEWWDFDEFQDRWKLDPTKMRTFDDWGAHACDLLHWFVGANPVHAFANSHTYSAQPPDDQSVMAFYTFDNNVMATIWMTYEMPSPGVGSGLQFLIVGSKGSIDLDPFGSVRLGTDGEWTTVYSQPPFDKEDPADGTRLEAFERALQDLLDCIDSGGTPLVNAREGLATQKMLEAARLSFTSGRAVSISPDPTSATVEVV
jgi:UDP-N-acetyl-2-amino-2-deoxyglucuronate dehydrogenase